MKQIILLTAIFFSINSFSIEKEPTSERLTKVKSRILIVELPAKDFDYINELQKSGKLDEIKKYEEKYNYYRTSIKTAFSKVWSYNEKIEFISSDSIKSFINGFTHLYAVIRYGERGKFSLNDKFNVRYVHNYGIANFILYLADEEQEVLYCITPLKQTVGAFMITLHQFNLCIDVMFKHPKSNATCVNSYSISREDKPKYETKKLTILIKKEDIINEKIDDDKIAKIYPYKYKIVESEEWENAIINQDPNFACLTTYAFPISIATHEDKNNNGSRYDDLASYNPGGIIIRAVHVARDGHIEAGDAGKKLVKILGAMKKQLDKAEQKCKTEIQ